MNAHLAQLQPYPFEKLAALKANITPPLHLPHIALSIGEPKHPAPPFVVQGLIEHLNGLGQYPATKGLPELRQAIAQWASQRFQLPQGTLTADHHVLPVAGTREALFAFAQAVVNPQQGRPCVVMPNPFYQIYEGAALLAGADPYFLNCTPHTGFIPDFSAVPADVWQRCQLVYICSPGNPTGHVLPLESLKQLIELADQYHFIIAGDECYSELYLDEAQPPLGLLQACAQMGRTDYARCVVFHSLSKRSNLPGLRSGFVAGDANILQQFLLYRTYQGCALPVPTQLASTLAWQDETHVIENRALYRKKFQQALAILQPVIPVSAPEGGFYLWLKTPIPAETFAQRLYAQQNVTVLPGNYLARPTEQGNPGADYVRMALVATLEECVQACERVRAFLEGL